MASPPKGLRNASSIDVADVSVWTPEARASNRELLEFDTSVEHLPGVLHVLPDHTSRLYSLASAEDFAARAREAALRGPAPVRVAGLIRVDWKSVVADDWYRAPVAHWEGVAPPPTRTMTGAKPAPGS